MKRHNTALEQLQKALTEYNQKCADAIDKFNVRLAAEGAATRPLNDYAKVSLLYKESMNNKGRQPDENLLSLSANTPQLSNYFTPSEDQKSREYMFLETENSR